MLVLQEMEKFLCEMIVSGSVQGRIHRPSKIVDLSAKPSTTDVLDQWGHGVHKLTDTLNKARPKMIVLKMTVCLEEGVYPLRT